LYITAYKTAIGMSYYNHVYGKLCHFPIEMQHKVFKLGLVTSWCIKNAAT